MGFFVSASRTSTVIGRYSWKRQPVQVASTAETRIDAAGGLHISNAPWPGDRCRRSDMAKVLKRVKADKRQEVLCKARGRFGLRNLRLPSISPSHHEPR